MRNMRTKVLSLFVGFLIVTYSQAQMGVPRIVINSMGHSAKVQSLVFTPDGERIVSVAEDKTIRLWSVSTGDMIKKFESQIGDGPEGMFYASAISPDGKLLAVAGYTLTNDKQVYIAIIDLQKGEQVATATGHTNVVNSLAFSGNGKYLFSGSDDGTLKAWTVANWHVYLPAATVNVGGPVKFLSVNPATLDVAVAVEGKSDVIVYPMAGMDKGSQKFTAKTWKDHKGEVNRLVYSTDGAFLASSSTEKEFNLWRADGSLVKEFAMDDMVNAIAFSHDSKILVGLDVSGKGQSFGVPAGNKFTDFNGHDNTVLACAFSPSENGSYIVASAGGNNNEIYLWNPINGRSIKKIKGKGSAIQDLAFGTGLELYVSQNANAKPNEFQRSFDFNNLKLNTNPSKFSVPAKKSSGLSQASEILLDLPKGKTVQNDPAVDGRILDFQATVDGSVIVASDYSLKMYDRNGFFQKEFLGHAGGVRAITLSADGRYLASGSEDQTIIIWKLSETGAAPSLRQAFPEASWANYFSSLPIDSLTKEPSKQAWKSVIDFLKANGDKTYKGN
jgi:FOG: WD40 repeat